MMNETYKLIGFANFCNVIPSFVYPIFSLKKKIYFEDGTSDTIKQFYEANQDLLPKLILAGSLDKEFLYRVGSKTVYAFWPSKNESVNFGDIHYIKKYLSEYKHTVSDNFLVDEINIFLDQPHTTALVSQIKRPYVTTSFTPKQTCLPRLSDFKVASDLLSHWTPLSSVGHFSSIFYNCSITDSTPFILDQTDYSAISDYYLCSNENKRLAGLFSTLIETYADIIFVDTGENETISEFVTRIVMKKDWLIPQSSLRQQICNRHENGFTPYPGVEAISSSSIAMSTRTIKQENNALNKLISFLFDVLTDRGTNIYDKLRNEHI